MKKKKQIAVQNYARNVWIATVNTHYSASFDYIVANFWNAQNCLRAHGNVYIAYNTRKHETRDELINSEQ